MGFLTSIVDGAATIANMYYQGKALVMSGEDVNKDAAKSYLAKTAADFFDGRIDGQQAVANGINALVDYKLTTYLEEKGVPAIFAKGAGLMASSLAGSLAKGVEDRLFTPKDTLDTAQARLEDNGRMPQPDQGMLSKLMGMLGGVGTEAIAPQPGGVYRQPAAGVT